MIRLESNCAGNSKCNINIIQKEEDGEVDQGKALPKGNLLTIAL